MPAGIHDHLNDGVWVALASTAIEPQPTENNNGRINGNTYGANDPDQCLNAERILKNGQGEQAQPEGAAGHKKSDTGEAPRVKGEQNGGQHCGDDRPEWRQQIID